MELKGYKSKLEALQNLISKMENGNLSIDELVELEQITRELHERSIILKYKIFEEKSGVQQMATSEVIENVEPVIQEEEEVVDVEETPLDFSIFGEEEEEPVMNMKEEIVEEEIEEMLEPEVEEHTSISVTQSETEDEKEVTIEVKETKEEISFMDKFADSDNSVASQFSGRKLDTLIGAFGLNERLRFINNLFDGSSELFSDAIKVLDAQNSMDEASVKVADYAKQHEWDPEEENVIEFMAYLKRRYA